MPTKIRAYSKEIELKGKSYLAIEQVDTEDIDATITELIDYYRARGASHISVAARPDCGLILADNTLLADHKLIFDTAFDEYTKALTVEAGPAFRTKKLSLGNESLYRAVYNEAFFDVPNSETLDVLNTAEIINDSKRDAGFFMTGGDPVGVYELDYSKDVPEIAAVAVRKEYWGRGFGRTAVRTLTNMLYNAGYNAVQLLAASTNVPALRLYQKSGFRKSRSVSTWYRIID